MVLFLLLSNSPGFHFTLEAQLCFVSGTQGLLVLIYGSEVQKPGAELPGGSALLSPSTGLPAAGSPNM